MPEIDRITFNEAMRLYWKTINTLPRELQGKFPNFEIFTEATGFGRWNQQVRGINVTEQGQRRLEMLDGPHARAMLTAFAAKEGK